MRIGGGALAFSLLAFPGAVAALAAGTGHATDVVLSGALAASSLGLALVALARPHIVQMLPYATVGVGIGATVTALASLPTPEPTGMYAAAAALLGVIAELLRARSVDSDTRRFRLRWAARLRRPAAAAPVPGKWSLSPPEGALAVTALPAALAVFSIMPALTAALLDPYAALGHVWQGPPDALLRPDVAGVDATSVLAALLLTAAAALAAIGFGERDAAQAIPVVLPGIAVTVLIAPIATRAAWPAIVLAGLTVFTVSMLGVALSPPPPATDRARPLRVARYVAFGVGLAAGGAGLAGSLATSSLTLVTLGGAVGVGLGAALGGRTRTARILGWLFAGTFAQLLVLTLGLAFGFPAAWSAFGVLGVGALLLVASSSLPRLRRGEALREASVVEWSGHAAALLALVLTYRSPAHVAALLAAWGAVLGIAANRPQRRPVERRALFWAAVACEITAWWLLMATARVAVPEAYTLPFAALALLVGVLEVRHRPELGSWIAYGPALFAAFGPTLFIVITTDASAVRQVLLLLGAVTVLVAGSMRRQQAPVMVGAVVTAVAALHALTLIGPWLILVPVGLILLLLGANNEKRRHEMQRLRGALKGMR